MISEPYGLVIIVHNSCSRDLPTSNIWFTASISVWSVKSPCGCVSMFSSCKLHYKAKLANGSLHSQWSNRYKLTKFWSCLMWEWTLFRRYSSSIFGRGGFFDSRMGWLECIGMGFRDSLDIFWCIFGIFEHLELGIDESDKNFDGDVLDFRDAFVTKF